MAAQTEPTGPNFAEGLNLAEAPDDGCIAGHVSGEPVLLSHFGGAWFAVGGACTHYGGALADGLVTGEVVRCPLHHACFSLRTGEAVAAPAFDPLAAWDVEVRGDAVFVTQRRSASEARPRPSPAHAPGRIVIVGGGAAGFAAAEMLRRRGYAGGLTLLSEEPDLPCDRPNLSKDYLAGTAPEEWIPLKDEAFYQDRGIDLRLGARAAALSRASDELLLADGEALGFDALLLATGAEPIRLAGPGFQQANVMALRTLSDARAIIAAAGRARRAAVVGASFIGLEVAASLRTRGLEVHVVAPEQVPMERVLGRDAGEYIRALHEAQGVVFHLGSGVQGYADGELKLAQGNSVAADLVVLGVGVRPRLDLAAEAGLAVDKGVLVDAGFRTSRPNVFAAGDIARYPDPRTAEQVRIEHWVAAERQGQAAALGMLGEPAPAPAPPFFWSNHYEAAIRYVGHAPTWDRYAVDGSLAGGEATIRYFQAGRLVAAASLGRDRENLELEVALAAGPPLLATV